MKRLGLFFILSLCLTGPATAQFKAGSAPAPQTAEQPAAQPAAGVDWQAFEEAIVTADSSGKTILVDIYAPWCGWCRRLQHEVYTDSTVQDYLAEHFEVARLNGDDTQQMYSFKGYDLNGMELAQGLGAEGFPTTVFLASNSDYITRLPGFAEAPEFLQILQYIQTRAFETQSFPEFVEGLNK